MREAHVPVLATELVESLDPSPGELAVDCTVGGAGHARIVGERLSSSGTLIGIDRDPAA
jgi:16S rRNA (cytosine1402-N4)-methyltransferase